MKKSLGRLLLALSIGLALPGVAQAQNPAGTWLREGGRSRVRIAPCGEALCGDIVWLRDPSGPGKVGQRVFYDMVADGAGGWSGRAYNPEDGKTYNGTMTLAGDRLTTAGCVLGGLICKSVNWTRAK